MKKFTFLIWLLVFIFSSVMLYADTVILYNGKRVKGLILDEYKDRIVLSTVDGEKSIMKSDIRSAIYDREAKALLQKGSNLLKKGEHIKAYYTYEKALELDPELEEARERVNYLRSYLETEMRYDVASRVRTRKEFFQNDEGKTMAQRATEELGLVLESGEKYVQVEKVAGAKHSNTADQLEEGDLIVSVWGETTAYMDADEVACLLLEPDECKLLIQRTVKPKLTFSKRFFDGLFFSSYRKIVGAVFKLKTKGVIVAGVFARGPFEKAGIEQGDLLFRVNGKNTRYMPMKKVIEIIKKNQGNIIDVTVRRKVTLWKKE